LNTPDSSINTSPLTYLITVLNFTVFVIIYLSSSILISFSYGFDKGPLQLKNAIPGFNSFVYPSC